MEEGRLCGTHDRDEQERGAAPRARSATGTMTAPELDEPAGEEGEDPSRRNDLRDAALRQCAEALAFKTGDLGWLHIGDELVKAFRRPPPYKTAEDIDAFFDEMLRRRLEQEALEAMEAADEQEDWPPS